jgi:DNA-binding MarR family transcriptional regulator
LALTRNALARCGLLTHRQTRATLPPSIAPTAATGHQVDADVAIDMKRAGAPQSTAMLTFRQLRYLDALARHGHFGRAAEECAVSQPALSMQIRELENELGAKLVERQQGATTLTEIGRDVARRAAVILNAARDLTDSALYLATRPAGAPTPPSRAAA